MPHTTPKWVVTDGIACDDHTLLITFTGGVQKRYDASSLLTKPLYAPLRDISFFQRAKAECGTVVWNDDIDIAPEHLYECSTFA